MRRECWRWSYWRSVFWSVHDSYDFRHHVDAPLGLGTGQPGGSGRGPAGPPVVVASRERMEGTAGLCGPQSPASGRSWQSSAPSGRRIGPGNGSCSRCWWCWALAQRRVPAAARFADSFTLHPARAWFLAILAVVGWCNYLPTRYWLAATCFFLAQTCQLAAYLPWLLWPRPELQAWLGLGLGACFGRPYSVRRAPRVVRRPLGTECGLTFATRLAPCGDCA